MRNMDCAHLKSNVAHDLLGSVYNEKWTKMIKVNSKSTNNMVSEPFFFSPYVLLLKIF